MSKTPDELTEEWKAGKLLAGDYYIKFENGEIERQNNCIGGFLMSCNNRVVQVLAPVPTYEEYKDMQEELAEHRYYCCCNENEVLRLKLAEMEELLSECQAHLSLGEIGTSVTPINVLLTRINAALGESEE